MIGEVLVLGGIAAAVLAVATARTPLTPLPHDEDPVVYDCFPMWSRQDGNTHLTLEVSPTSPRPGDGIPITFYGRLTGRSLVPGVEIGIAGATIEFWDAAGCRRFDQTQADNQGRFSYQRPLHPDELGGYAVQAVYQGLNRWPVVNFDGAATGVWLVHPVT